MSAHIKWHANKKGVYLIADLDMLDSLTKNSEIKQDRSGQEFEEVELQKSKKEEREYQIENNIFIIKDAYFYDFSEHQATIMLQPINTNQYKVCLLCADGEKRDQIIKIFKTFVGAIEHVNEYYLKNKEKRGRAQK